MADASIRYEPRPRPGQLFTGTESSSPEVGEPRAGSAGLSHLDRKLSGAAGTVTLETLAQVAHLPNENLANIRIDTRACPGSGDTLKPGRQRGEGRTRCV